MIKGLFQKSKSLTESVIDKVSSRPNSNANSRTNSRSNSVEGEEIAAAVKERKPKKTDYVESTKEEREKRIAEVLELS